MLIENTIIIKFLNITHNYNKKFWNIKFLQWYLIRSIMYILIWQNLYYYEYINFECIKIFLSKSLNFNMEVLYYISFLIIVITRNFKKAIEILSQRFNKKCILNTEVICFYDKILRNLCATAHALRYRPVAHST